MTVEAGKAPQKRRYWSYPLEKVESSPGAAIPETAGRQLQKLMLDAVVRRMVADVPLGAGPPARCAGPEQDIKLLVEEKKKSKNLVKDVSFRVVKATLKAILVYLLYFLLAPMLHHRLLYSTCHLHGPLSMSQ
jgi:hypothetical protein